MAETSIEWLLGADGSKGQSWNALRAEREIERKGKTITVSAHHCEHVNEACRFCYAGKGNFRLGGLEFKPGNRFRYRFTVDKEKLLAPLRRKKPTKIFVESMSDAFGEWWPTEFIDQLYAVMALTPQHTYINLSKRPERRRQYLDGPRRHNAIELAAEKVVRGPESLGGKHVLPRLPLRNVIEGTSVSNQAEADEFIPILLNTKAALRCVSCEPLLAPIDLTDIPWGAGHVRYPESDDISDGFDALRYVDASQGKLDWLITGGESGSKARGAPRAWFASLRDQCKAAGVAYFHKQNGEWIDADEWLSIIQRGPSRILIDGKPWAPHRPLNYSDAQLLANTGCDRLEHHSDGSTLIHVGKKAAGRLLDGVEHNGFPLRAEIASPNSSNPAGGSPAFCMEP